MKRSKEYLEKAKAYTIAKIERDLQEYYDLVNDVDIEWVDGDGYPTHYALKRIELFPYQEDEQALFQFIKTIWWMPSWGWGEEYTDVGTEYHLSTGGWSGNESIIHAMKSNELFWHSVWIQSRRGGHYIFEVKNEK